ncbi:Bifunctional transcriptional activator/DNA repair enzyme AdaA [compost metagenome]
MLIDAGPNPGDLRQWVKTYFSQEIDRTFQDNSGRVGVILPTNDFPLARLEEIGLRIYRELMDSIDPSIIVTFSDSLTGIGSIRELYLHSLKIGNSKRSQGKTGVFYYTNHNHENHAIDIYKENVKELTDIFAAGDINRITVMVDKIINSFNEEWLDIGIAKAHMADLELSLCRRVAKMNGDPNSLMTSIQEKHGSLGGIVNYSILKRYLHDLCQDAASLLSQLTRQNENNTIFHVIQYVDREFQKKMQLQDLAKHFHMNATYLGQLFKKQTGKPFNEYVNEKRIKEAKKLLKHTQMKISEVALQVGYPNTDYFISKFKSSTGILPSVYKHELEKKKQTD